MDQYELASALFGKSSATNVTRTTTISGQAIGDSSDGYVSVLIGNEAVEVATTADIREGDTVQVTVTGRTPTVTGVVGGGDRTRDSITAIANFFWHDSEGAHVSTQEYSTAGRNLLATSTGLFIKSGATIESQFTDTFAQIGRDNQSHLKIQSKKMEFIPGSASDGATFAVDTERETLAGNTYDNATVSSNTANSADFSQFILESGSTASVSMLSSSTHGTADEDGRIEILAKSADSSSDTDTALIVSENAITVEKDGGTNGWTVPAIYMGKKTITVSGDSGVMWTGSAFASEFGHTFSAWTDFIAFMNPNGSTAHIDGCTVSNGDIYAVFDRSCSGSFTIGYCVITTDY